MKQWLTLSLVVLVFFVLSGCIWPTPSPSPGPGPSPAPGVKCGRVYVQSNNYDSQGYIVINDVNTGVKLYPWGAALVEVDFLQCGDIVRVNLINEAGAKSHTQVTTASSPQAIVTFNWFLHYPGYH